MFEPSKIDNLNTNHIARLLIQPWQVNQLFHRYSLDVHTKIFRIVALTRALMTSAILLFFVLSEPITWHIIAIPAVYVLFTLWLFFYIQYHKNQVKSFSFLNGLLELLVIAYILIFDGYVELEFIFLSLIMSATLLTLFSSLILYIIASITIVINWAHIDIANILSYHFYQGITLSPKASNVLLEPTTIKGLILVLLLFFFVTVIINRLTNWAFQNEIHSKFYYKQARRIQTFLREVSNSLKGGIILLNLKGQVIHINATALQLLNITDNKALNQLSNLSPLLQNNFQQWLHSEIYEGFSYRHNINADEVYVSFSHFEHTDNYPLVMMTLENLNVAIKQNQETKLVALGRMTAGIAHEIRNPLASIHSAAELLHEIPTSEKETKLTQMILKNIKRANRIIDNMLGLFSKKQPEPQLLSLQETLDYFTQNALKLNPTLSLNILHKDKEPLFFSFDATQFDQVLYNLVHNAIKHANVEPLAITIKTHLSSNRKNIHIDIIDNGQGIAPEHIGRLFEPFFTQGNSGSGLGLYLVREICTANQSRINYINNLTPKSKGTTFRIITPAYFSANTQPQIH